MSVYQVTRVNPQPLLAVPVSMGTAFEIAALFAAVVNRFSSVSQTGTQYPGGWRLTIQRDGYPDQFAYPGDWLLITDATFTESAGMPQWTASKTTEISVYGVSSGLAGTAADFLAAFTSIDPANPLP